MANFAKNIKSARLGAKLTQDELAENISVTRQAVSNWENGKTEPDIDTLTKLAEVTNVTVEELIYGINPNDEQRDVKTYKRLAIIFGIFCFKETLEHLPFLLRRIWLHYIPSDNFIVEVLDIFIIVLHTLYVFIIILSAKLS